MPDKLPYNYLIYSDEFDIFTNDYKLKVIGVNTDDIFHTIGEYLYRSFVSIKQLNFGKCNQAKLDYWKHENYEIHEFNDKYRRCSQWVI